MLIYVGIRVSKVYHYPHGDWTCQQDFEYGMSFDARSSSYPLASSDVEFGPNSAVDALTCNKSQSRIFGWKSYVTNPYHAKTDSDQIDEVGMVVFCVVDFEQDESPVPIWVEQAERQGSNSGAKEPVSAYSQG